MKVSLEWIKEYVEIDVPLSALVDKLNMIGLVVETWEERDGNVILDIETHANRPDTLGHLGIAREIAVAFCLPFQDREWPLASSGTRTSDLVDIQILEGELGCRYCGIVVQDVKVEPSPDWLKKRIEAMGLNPINNVVDVTKYVLFSTGHPIHAFDLPKLLGHRIIVRQAKKGEVLRTLEGEDVELFPPMLVIADAKKPVALAGVIGGEESAVSEATVDVFIESAWFDPVSVRKTSKATGIQTEASYRFERCADISYPQRAAQMAASLLTQFGGKASEGILDVYPSPRKSRRIVLRHHQIGALLGMDIEEAFVQDTLSHLGFHLEVLNDRMWQVFVPSFRVDIEREVDLIEELARFYGYDKVPSHLPPLAIPEPPPKEIREKIRKVRLVLTHQGFDEVVNYSFSDPEKDVHFLGENQSIVIRNPISQRASLLRTSLLGGLLDNIAWNMNRGAEGVHVFEIGNIYFWAEERAREELMLGLASSGMVEQKNIPGEEEEANFFLVKGACEVAMTYLRYEPFSFQEEDHEYFRKGFSLALVTRGEKVGFLGELKPEICASYEVKERVCAAEIDLASLLSKKPQPFQHTPVVKFPSVSRDISFLVDRNVSYQSIKQLLEELKTPYLERFLLLDRFSGPTIPKGKISFSFRFIYRHPQRTLLAKEIDNLQAKIIKRLQSNLKIQLREGGKIDK